LALAELAISAGQAGDPARASRLADDAEALARHITNPHDQARALAELAAPALRAGDPDRARRVLALAIIMQTPEVGWLTGTVSRLFPSVIAAAGQVFLAAYRADR
jgi:hypothetical protein